MRILQGELDDVRRYIENNRGQDLEQKRAQYDGIMRVLRKFHTIDPRTSILEVGTGTGWFPVQCALDGLNCKGLEISPRLIDFARELGRRYGVDPRIELGNLEETDVGEERWDVILASSVFEHVEFWRRGLAKVYRALKPGGVLYFESTNKFSFTSGEYGGIPLYGWLPDSVRYALRRRVHGADIMQLGIDFHQFRHGQLRREFSRLGFSEIYDRIEIAEEDWISTRRRRRIVRLARRWPPVKSLALAFADATRFVCIK